MLRQVLALPQEGHDLYCWPCCKQADSGVRTFAVMPWPPAPIPARNLGAGRANIAVTSAVLAMSKAATLTTRALAEQTWWTSTQTLKRKAGNARASMTY
jgi:hypothetical protein